MRAADGLIELRESDDAHIIVRTTPANFAAFLQGIKAGEFDHFTAHSQRIVPAAPCSPARGCRHGRGDHSRPSHPQLATWEWKSADPTSRSGHRRGSQH
ncbi:hypothetical protein [Kitasatospora sp. NPDC047058]|uniref:hypothetical protein n=1 Tax=Kitasatospora sp. NPDC047058 TaxID=3155620 RepID=UPI0033F2CE7E